MLDYSSKLTHVLFQTYLEYSRRGARVLALAYKNFGKLETLAARELKREDVEKDLTFAGFLIISCPLKQDSKAAIKELVKSSHKVVMITGDNPLTACHVAKELRFTRKTVLILTSSTTKDVYDQEPHFVWQSINEDEVFQIDEKNYTKLVKDYDLAITGDGLKYLYEHKHDYYLNIVPYISVYARFAPKQKEFVVTTMKSLGYFTLMCGDGTNDVGALKHAHVGVSILSNASVTTKKKNDDTTASTGSMTNSRASARSSNTTQLTARQLAIARHREMSDALLKKAMKDIEEVQVQVVKLGDASIAAPFTSKLSSINCGKWFNIHIYSSTVQSPVLL